MARSEEVQGRRRAGFSLTQETITILTVGVALAGLIVVNLGDMRSEVRAYRAEALAYRAEARADREAIRAEARTDRTRFEAAMNLMRAEARADREAFAKQNHQARRATGNIERSRRRPPSCHRLAGQVNRERSEEMQDKKRVGFSLTQETITILTVGVALAGLIVVNLGDMRSEARAYRAEARAEAPGRPRGNPCRGSRGP